eukprot:GSA120T00018344001.1
MSDPGGAGAAASSSSTILRPSRTAAAAASNHSSFLPCISMENTAKRRGYKFNQSCAGATSSTPAAASSSSGRFPPSSSCAGTTSHGVFHDHPGAGAQAVDCSSCSTTATRNTHTKFPTEQQTTAFPPAQQDPGSTTFQLVATSAKSSTAAPHVANPGEQSSSSRSSGSMSIPPPTKSKLHYMMKEPSGRERDTRAGAQNNRGTTGSTSMSSIDLVAEQFQQLLSQDQAAFISSQNHLHSRDEGDRSCTSSGRMKIGISSNEMTPAAGSSSSCTSNLNGATISPMFVPANIIEEVSTSYSTFAPPPGNIKKGGSRGKGYQQYDYQTMQPLFYDYQNAPGSFTASAHQAAGAMGLAAHQQAFAQGLLAAGAYFQQIAAATASGGGHKNHLYYGIGAGGGAGSNSNANVLGGKTSYGVVDPYSSFSCLTQPTGAVPGSALPSARAPPGAPLHSLALGENPTSSTSSSSAAPAGLVHRPVVCSGGTSEKRTTTGRPRCPVPNSKKTRAELQASLSSSSSQSGSGSESEAGQQFISSKKPALAILNPLEHHSRTLVPKMPPGRGGLRPLLPLAGTVAVPRETTGRSSFCTQVWTSSAMICAQRYSRRFLPFRRPRCNR